MIIISGIHYFLVEENKTIKLCLSMDYSKKQTNFQLFIYASLKIMTIKTRFYNL